jgi:4-amino-4-deoxy-L-arabinose transferase-like glycosyltransferase
VVALIKKHSYFLALLFLGGLLLRALVFYGYLSCDANYWQVDSATYHMVGKGIADGLGISMPNGTPNFYRVPGYPIFLGLFYRCFGDRPISALWVQVFLAALIPLLIFLLSLAFFPKRPRLAMASGIYGACHLGLVLYSGFMMTESLFLLFFLGFLLCLFSYKKDTKLLAVAGFLLGIASLIRPVGHYVVFITIIGLLLKKGLLVDRVRNSLLLFGSWLVPVAMWLARNYVLVGQLFFHTLPGGHFLHLSASRVVMHVENTTYQQARMKVSAQAHKIIRDHQKRNKKVLTEIERCNIMESVAASHFKAHPWISLKLWLTDMFRTSFSLYSAELLYLASGRKEVDYFAKDRSLWDMIHRYLVPKTDSLPLKAIVWLEILLYAFVLFGFALGLRHLCLAGSEQDKSVWFMGLGFIALFIVISLAGGYARMRLPIEPLLIIFGLSGVVHEKRKKA